MFDVKVVFLSMIVLNLQLHLILKIVLKKLKWQFFIKFFVRNQNLNINNFVYLRIT